MGLNFEIEVASLFVDRLWEIVRAEDRFVDPKDDRNHLILLLASGNKIKFVKPDSSEAQWVPVS